MQTKWDAAYKATIWDGKGTSATFDRVYVHEPDGEYYVKVKLNRQQLSESPIPSDCGGWELLVSMDEDASETHEGEIQDTSHRNRHRILTIPGQQPAIFRP